MPMACHLRSWEESLPPELSHRLSLVGDLLRASTIWPLPSLNKIRPYIVAGGSCFWRATMKAQQRRLVRLLIILVFHQFNLAHFRKVDYLYRRAEITGVV